MQIVSRAQSITAIRVSISSRPLWTAFTYATTYLFRLSSRTSFFLSFLLSSLFPSSLHQIRATSRYKIKLTRISIREPRLVRR